MTTPQIFTACFAVLALLHVWAVVWMSGKIKIEVVSDRRVELQMRRIEMYAGVVVFSVLAALNGYYAFGVNHGSTKR